MSDRTHEIEVRGGRLHVGEWGAPGGPVVLAVHGITASHRSWGQLARALPEVRLLAPDLRGRGGSRDLPGPWGTTSHADDLAAVLRELGDGPALVVGHSMGAFVSVVLARRHPDLVSSLVLVDGGIPVEVPEHLAPEEVGDALLGPAAERLRMTFPTPEAYRDFWRVHPAFTDWNDVIEDYVDYDLVGTAPRLHPATVVDAVAEDSLELAGGHALLDALEHLDKPTTLLRAPYGLLGSEPALYTRQHARAWADRLGAELQEVPETNHYTITLGPAGAQAVAGAVRSARTRTEAHA